MRIVGIDPGTNRVGYALIEARGRTPTLINAETIEIPPKTAGIERLTRIAKALVERFERDRPDGAAVEKLFFTKNVKTALSVAEARGVILLTASRYVRSIWEYTPLEVKQSVTGNGAADKAAVSRMIRMSMPGAKFPRGDDAMDAIAIALTGMWRHDREQ